MGTGVGKLRKELTVGGTERLNDGVLIQTLLFLCQLEEGERADNHRPGDDPLLLRLEELVQGFGSRQGDGLRCLELGLDVVVVRVEPLLHRQSFDVALLALVTAGLGKICFERGEPQVAVPLGDDAEEDGGVEGLIVEGKVTGGNLIDPCVTDQLPLSLTQFLSCFLELSGGDLAAEEFFGGELELAVGAHAGEADDCRGHG